MTRSVSLVSLSAIMLCCLMATSFVSARSNGVLSSCDLSPKIYGSGKVLYPNGMFGQNKSNTAVNGANTNIMKWADAPTPTKYFTLRTSDDSTPQDDPTSYIPGRMTTLHLRVTDIRRRWIGLVLYATNVTQTGNATQPGQQIDNQVGSWSFPPDTSSIFQTGNGNCLSASGNVVTHMDADPKPLHTRFYFTAPKGTGKVTIKLLIKQGEQNKGSFFYLSPSLTLTEGVVPIEPSIPQPVTYTSTNEPVLSKTLATQYVVSSSRGDACANVCLKQTPATPYCHATATTNLNSANAVDSVLDGRLACRLPLLQGCPYAGAPFVDDDGYCSYRVTTLSSCPKAYASVNQTLTPPPNVCFSQAGPTHRPICACTNDRSQQPINPYASKSGRRLLSFIEKDYDEPVIVVSGASSSSSSSSSSMKLNIVSIFIGLIASVFASSSSSTTTTLKRSSSSLSFMIVLVCVVMLIMSSSPQSVSAHNYIKSVHRAREAAVSIPCQVRISNQPHVQVIANQKFEVEWALGHPDAKTPYYFAIVSERDYMQLAAPNITDIIRDYLKLAPQNASQIPVGWNRVHLNNRREYNLYNIANTPLNLTYLIPQYFEEYNITASHPEFKVRDPIYKAKARPSSYQETNPTYGPVAESTYKPQYLTKDMRATYQSSKYPWISSAAIFYNSFGTLNEHYVVVDQADMAQFSIPSYAGPGNHVLYFNWAGYKDCVDINVMDQVTPVDKRYGLVKNATDPPRVVRQDHCEVTFVPQAYTIARKVNRTTMDVSQCIADCKSSSYCDWVNVVRASNLPTTLPIRPNIPYVWFKSNSSLPAGTFQPCADRSADMRQMYNETVPETTFAMGCGSPYFACDKARLALADDDYVCYGTVALRDQDFQVEEDYRISYEPEDPIFYSTCYYMDPNGRFLNQSDPVWEVPDWRSGDHCLSCSFQQQLAKSTVFQIPKWENGLTTDCQPCEQTQSTNSKANWDKVLAGSNLVSAGRLDAAPYTPPVSSSSSSAGNAPKSSSTATNNGGSSTGVSQPSSTGGTPKSSTASNNGGGSSTSSNQASTGGNSGSNQVSSTSTPKSSTASNNGGASSTASNNGAGSSTSSNNGGTTGGNGGGSGSDGSSASNSNGSSGSSNSGSSSTGSDAAAGGGGGGNNNGNGQAGLNSGDDPSSGSSGLSTMAIALIIAGGAIGVIILGVVLFFAIKSVMAKSASSAAMSKLAADSHQARGSTA